MLVVLSNHVLDEQLRPIDYHLAPSLAILAQEGASLELEEWVDRMEQVSS
jgi:hypothetical protein